jgi:catechol 2,3-dioxygenase-like lactoylglutathione lyase family enzyme
VPAQLNHTIVNARDNEASARFLVEVLGLDAPGHWGPFVMVETANGVSLDYIQVFPDQEIAPQHYAFLVTEPEFDEIYRRLQERGLDHWADPHREHPGEINHNDGGRGVYWLDPDGHFLEILTVPYGGWPS